MYVQAGRPAFARPIEKQIQDTTREDRKRYQMTNKNFVHAYFEVAAKSIPTKPRTKYRVPWEMLAVREKHAHVKNASKI